MTMYLPNSDIHTTGAEPGEFIELPDRDQPDNRHVPTAGLDPQMRLNIARWAKEYIAGVVENHHGDGADVRAVIHDLNHQVNVLGPNVGRPL